MTSAARPMPAGARPSWPAPRRSKQRERATRALSEAETQLYYNTITLADHERLAKRIARIEPVLAKCPERLRNWEWHFLRRLGHTDLLTFRGHSTMVNAAAFGPDGALVASADDKSNVLVWDAATGRVVRSLSARPRSFFNITIAEVTALAFRPDGKQLAASVGGLPKTLRFASTGPESVTAWNLETGAVALTLKGHTGSITGVAYSRDGKRLASVSFEKMKPVQLKVWDSATGKEQLTIAGAGRCVAFSPDGKRLASASGQVTDPFKAFAMPGAQFKIQAPPAGGPPTNRNPFEERDVKVWDAATGAAVLTLRGHYGDVTAVAFSPDGRTPGLGRRGSDRPDLGPRFGQGSRDPPGARRRDPRPGLPSRRVCPGHGRR